MYDGSLRDWLERVALPGQRVTSARPMAGGYSNDNALLTTAGGGAYVLRRYRRANTCPVETALARRLAGVVPVAEVVAADETGADAGEPVLLSVYVPGRPLGELLSGTGAAGLGRAAGTTLARAGTATFPAPGFFTDGRLEPGPAEPTAGLDAFVDRCLREGNAAGHLSGAEQCSLRRLAERTAPELAVLHGSRQLVHGDYNPKNLLAADGRVVAVLDWEFAFSSSPLYDIGNMLRDPRPSGFAEAFVAGFRDGGGELPDDWRRLSRALDLYSLADLLTRPPTHRYFARAVERIRALLA
ncbi:aminoglycoside phosphotransferase family protein [Dactylosporangium sp. AC04546]|uniref:phosphotransferase family protein n=1 Tax=Dactylosporangium sp. AC04546 TaxID=2862460 RepID=UPI001EDD2F3E|nr:aminoglycoside phosphotransferase family protein [Dactylosporangium sp. AC04546]WVK79319.1 aminoglycoside phosphotransferase family protein [Dactylosporangium sp. AC04546]